MKKKNAFLAAIGTFGGLCALCCVLPIAGLIGLGSLEAFFCDNPFAIWMGIGLMVIGFGALALRLKRKSCKDNLTASTCTTGCGCKPSVQTKGA